MSQALLLLPVLLPILFWGFYHYHKDRHLPEPIGHLLLAFGLGLLSAAGGLPATSQLDDWDESDAEQHSLQVKFNCCCEKPVLWGIIKVNDDPIVTVKP